MSARRVQILTFPVGVLACTIAAGAGQRQGRDSSVGRFTASPRPCRRRLLQQQQRRQKDSTPEPFALAGSFYINGASQTWVGQNRICPAETPGESNPNRPMELIMNYALDYYNSATNSHSDTDPNFTSGTRQFIIKSAAVYEDAANAGQNYVGGGIAPGTTIPPQNARAR